uniref:Zmp:0000000735 n=1 Tax=Cyprinus carpio TaxID=7962 RepID=A0A8C2CZM0_CYPCA
ICKFISLPYKNLTWTESMVSNWLTSIGVKETYVKKLNEEEVDGRILCELSEEYLEKKIGMKSGPALLIIKKRDELITSQKARRKHLHKQTAGKNDHEASAIKSVDTRADIREEHKEDSVTVTTKRDSKLRPFDMKGVDFTYVKNSVLLPESGVVNYITPCHEYKSFAIASKLDRQRLQAKFAKEVLKFATGCINVRTNGTIHFGVMDSRGDTGYTHGEIIGIPVKEKDVYCDALDYIERSFSSSDSELVRLCIGEPQFVQVVCLNSNEELYEKWHILVTNRFQEKDLQSIDFLLNMNIFCMFDFDPDSNVSGLCHEYSKHHAVNRHFMQNYKIPSGLSIREFESHLRLFDQISWIFCNGRNDFKGNEPPCDEKTWVKTKRTLLKDCVSLICKDILPKGTFHVIFLLTSPVDTPFLNTFYEFITDMEGHEDIICLAESEENFKEWQRFALGSCDRETVNSSSVVGMTISQINATLQQVQPTTTQASKRLPIHVKGECFLDTRDEEMRCSLEILSLNHCEETSSEFIESEKETIEQQFYHGGKVTWMNLWLADKKIVGEVIQRDAYSEVNGLVKDCLCWSLDRAPIRCINIYHHPGSGGSTVARQILWNYRRDLRCAVVKPSYSATVVSEDAIWLREYEEKDPQKCLPVLLLFEDCDKEYLEDVKYELEVAINTKKITRGTLCFILLSCRRSHNPEKMCKESVQQNISITHKLSETEKKQFSKKRQSLEKQFNPEFILTFVLMSEEFESHKIAEYVKQFVKHLLQGINPDSVVTKLVLYVSLLNTYVQNSFISQSHCEALLALSFHLDRFRQHAFETSLSEQARLVLIHLRDENTYINSIRIIHPLVAKELLQQLGDKQQQSDLALNLLNNDVLFEHRFGKDQYIKFLRDLFMTRSRISKGDKLDTFFSPLIEHVREKECPDKAIELLKAAYKRFNEDAFFAQQLARLNYKHDRFEEAEQWAKTAVAKRPNNSYFLDTKGQVYREWFAAKCKAMDQDQKTPENTIDALEMALKAIECFQECKNAAMQENETMNNAGLVGIVEVGCALLKLMSTLHVFSRKKPSEFIRYLLDADYIPVQIEKPWEHFHYTLKNIQKLMLEALEWISEDLSYFQTDLNTDEEKTSETVERTIKHPMHCGASQSKDQNQEKLSPLMKRMMIYYYGGGNITTIFSLLTNQKDGNPVMVLEHIISLYPSNPMRAQMPQVDLVNYIASHFALSCFSTNSPKLAAFQDLQRLSHQFPKEKPRCLPSALFLHVLLFWPEEHDTEEEKEHKYETVLFAVEHLQRLYDKKLKDIPPRKKRIYTHFFLSNGTGFEKFVHKSKFETITKVLSVSEKRLKWFSGEVWKMPEMSKLLKCVSGWTEDEKVFLEGPKGMKFHIPALKTSSVPHNNENVTFYLGFTLKGPVAYNITVQT